jgi:hypothetical protein
MPESLVPVGQTLGHFGHGDEGDLRPADAHPAAA